MIEWTNNCVVYYSQNKILYSSEKERTAAPCINMGESKRNNAQQKKTSCRGVLSVSISFKLNDDILLDIHNLEKTKGMINLKFRF